MNVLSNQALLTPRVSIPSFTESEWSRVLSHLALVIGDDAQRYADVPAAKLSAAIPYLAGSEDPDRFAVSNLLTFHGATKARELFSHRASDSTDLYRRFACFNVGSAADPEVVQYGLDLLALISLNDHERDKEQDLQKGKFNPVAAGAWNFEELSGNLRNRLASNRDLANRFEQTMRPLDAYAMFWSGLR